MTTTRTVAVAGYVPATVSNAHTPDGLPLVVLDIGDAQLVLDPDEAFNLARALRDIAWTTGAPRNPTPHPTTSNTPTTHSEPPPPNTP
jgi:hypothetical protein